MPNCGRAHECITSVDAIYNDMLCPVGRTNLLSTTRALFSTESDSIVESNPKKDWSQLYRNLKLSIHSIFEYRLYEYDQYHWCPVIQILMMGWISEVNSV
jgi:hypothetical protein